MRLTILAWPLDRSQENPYTNNLYRALRARGHRATEFSFRALIATRYHVLHVHWPEGVLRKRGPGAAIIAAVAMGAVLALARMRGASVVWTVHNMQPHEAVSGVGLSVLRLMLRSTVSGLVYLSEISRRQYEEAQPWAGRKRSVITPHGRFGSSPQPIGDRSAIRRELGVGDTERLISFLGRMEPYKGPQDLVAAFLEMRPTKDLRLLMAGGIPDAPEGVALRQALGDGGIIFEEGWLSDARFAQLCVASDLIAYPYRRILNSGSVLLPLEYETPVLAPNQGSVPEVAHLVGAGWVRLYDGDLSPDVLAAAAELPRPDAPPDLGAFEWDSVAQTTERFLTSLVAR